MRRPKYAPCSFLFSPGRLRRPKYASVSLSLSLSFSVSVSLSLSLSFSLSSLSFFPFFFFPSLGYFLYFLFARLGMACSSSASLPSRPLSSTRSRSFLRWLGLLPSETRNLASPLFLFLVWGFARGDPTWGLSVSFGLPCSVCFLLGSSPGFGARGFFSPRKSGSRPSLRGVCVCGVTECPVTTFSDSQQGAQGVSASPAPTKTLAVNS